MHAQGVADGGGVPVEGQLRPAAALMGIAGLGDLQARGTAHQDPGEVAGQALADQLGRWVGRGGLQGLDEQDVVAPRAAEPVAGRERDEGHDRARRDRPSPERGHGPATP